MEDYSPLTELDEDTQDLLDRYTTVLNDQEVLKIKISKCLILLIFFVIFYKLDDNVL